MCVCLSLFRLHRKYQKYLCLHRSAHKLHLHVHIKLHDVEIVVCAMIFSVFAVYLYKFEQVLNMKLILTSSHERTYDTWYYIIYLNIVLLLHIISAVQPYSMHACMDVCAMLWYSTNEKKLCLRRTNIHIQQNQNRNNEITKERERERNTHAHITMIYQQQMIITP